MKKNIFIASALVILSASTISAQEVPTKQKNGLTKEQRLEKRENNLEQRAQKHVDVLNADVQLTTDQQTKVKELAAAKIKKVQEIKAKYGDKPENKELAKKEMNEARMEYRKSVKALLTPEQLEKLKAKRAKQKEAMKAKKANATAKPMDNDDVEEILD